MKFLRLLAFLMALTVPAASIAQTRSGPVEWSQLNTAIGWNVVVPTGVLATDTANLTAAFATAATRSVRLAPGAFNVCSQLTVPDYGVVKAEQGVPWFFWSFGVLPTTRLRCSGTSAFTSGQAFIKAGDYSLIEGIAVVGLAYPSPGSAAGVNCFDVSNTFYVTLRNDQGIGCNDGILASSDGTSTPNAHVEGLKVFGGLYSANDSYGVESIATNSGFFSDAYFGGDQLNIVGNSKGGMVFDYIGGVQFIGTRIEDNFDQLSLGNKPIGLNIKNGNGHIVIADNLFDRNGGQNLRIGGNNGSGGISITGNVSQFPFWRVGSNTGTSYHVEFANFLYNLQMSGNVYAVQNGAETTWTNFIYKCTGCTFYGNASFMEYPPFMLNGVYYDAATEAAIAPYIVRQPSMISQTSTLAGGQGLTPSAWTPNHVTQAQGSTSFGASTIPAASVVEDTANSSHNMVQIGGALLANTPYTLSCYIKNKSGTDLLSYVVSSSGAFSDYVNLVVNPVTGARANSAAPVGTGKVLNYSIVPVGDGWFQALFSYAFGAAASFPNVQLALNNAGGASSYTGDGTSGVYLWDCQNNFGLGLITGVSDRTTSAPSNPTGTTNTTGLMMGLAGSITPNITGNVRIAVNGTISNPTAIADGAKVQIRVGTGTAPANAAALTGTVCGTQVQYVAATTAQKAPFSLDCYATGLTPGVAEWIDVGLAAITGGTATISDVNIVATEQ